ncbi:hypothetical protein K1719_044846 [Acacia pycnantha]|nr:hypothetical protein K1719_044846 [Acacia pycnantha]
MYIPSTIHKIIKLLTSSKLEHIRSGLQLSSTVNMKIAGASSMFRMAAIVVAILVAVLISTTEASYYRSPSSDDLWQAEAITCTGVIQEVHPCRGYIIKAKRIPTKSCCKGVKEIYDKAKTRPDRIEVCECIKRALSVLESSYDPQRIPLIPKTCGLHFSLPAINEHSNCNKVVPPSF